MGLYDSYLRIFVYLPLVLLFLYLLLQLFKHLSPSLGYQGRIYVVEKVMISPRVLLLVVKVGEEYLLLSSAASGVTLLKELGRDWGEGYPKHDTGRDYLAVLLGKKFRKKKNFKEEFDDLTRK
ncbi:MAG TPA: flagellar biosynthetic protein FliO [Firmicutes bacterium]|jgi:flagellar biogenesis protein FliO|nr:flagellar biosynthetic protein FliO [Bacillota bacterium]